MPVFRLAGGRHINLISRDQCGTRRLPSPTPSSRRRLPAIRTKVIPSANAVPAVEDPDSTPVTSRQRVIGAGRPRGSHIRLSTAIMGFFHSMPRLCPGQPRCLDERSYKDGGQETHNNAFPHISPTSYPTMSSEIETVQPRAPVTEAEKANVEHVGDLKTEANFRADAMEAENAEHAMSVTEAVKAYPMACLWAFIMSSTIIVSPMHSIKAER